MVEGIHRFLDRETAAARSKRTGPPDRERLRKIIGAVDARVEVSKLRMLSEFGSPSLVGRGNGYQVHLVSWPVFPGTEVEGLLLNPDQPPAARVVALPDADWSPEMLAGLEPGLESQAQFARRLAENGCQVLIPVLIDRKDTWSGIPGIKMTNEPHREWIYRMAFEVGRHIIGYEVQETLAAVDWFAKENQRHTAPILVAGYGEGGLLALYAAALDARITATLVSGYFQPREQLWKEPIYRDVWSLVKDFGDAELAGLIAPRGLIIEASRHPQVSGPPPETRERAGATPNGAIVTPPLSAVQQEAERAKTFFTKVGSANKLTQVASDGGHGPPGSDTAITALLGMAGIHSKLRPSQPVERLRPDYDTSARMHRQFDRLVEHTQQLVRTSPARREQFWAKADSSSPERWRDSTRFYRDYIWNEVIGRLPDPTLPANARSRLVYDEPEFRGYEIMLDVWPDVFAYGILLIPKNLKPGERRPVVVCQHGLEGRPTDVADPKVDSHFYHRFAVRLAQQGFVTYAPQNPYIGKDRFRLIQRKGHPLKLALFSFILGQHQRTLEWLAQQPFVDPARIGFYGLSYGGKTAVRVPPLLSQYALSICSADFNEWVWKNTRIDSKYSYMASPEYDMIEFDFANVVNYSELASLMAPRPFMVERGHYDGVAPDDWVAFEFAKVRRFFATRMNMPDRAQIEFFNGPHTINGQGTFEFLRRYLKWQGSESGGTR